MYPVKRPRSRAWIWIVGALAALVLATVGILFWAHREFTLSVDTVGEERMVLDYGAAYSEPGAEVSLCGSHFLREGIHPGLTVHTDGTVDTDTVGSYTVTYSVEILWWKVSDRRIVQIVDREPPVITLVSDPGHVTPAGESYREEGFSAVDEYDGDLTDRVVRVEENGVVTYTVTDSSGNRTEVSRTISYSDTMPPEITLLGDAVMRLNAGKQYTEPGFSAFDNTDGDLTEMVTVSGEVDPYHAGNYTLTYSVRDRSGNQTEISRTVEVVAAQQPETVTPSGKVIYLTFDDGPSSYTDQLLRVLAKYHVKATFFVVGNNVERMREIVEGGHAIGIHTVSHNYRRIYASESAFFEDLYRMQENIYNATGVWTTLMRFPGGSSNTVSCFNDGIMTALTQAVQEQGFQYFDWNVDSNDAGGAKDSQTVYINVINGVQRQNVSIVLQHDTQSFSVEAVEDIIIWGIANGYTFLPLESTSPNCHHGVNN